MTFELMLFPNFKDKAFMMSYDDGVRQDIRLIEIMQKYGLKGTFNLNSGFMQAENRVKPDEVEGVYLKTGNEVAVHGVKHLSLTAITEDRMIDDILNDMQTLSCVDKGKIGMLGLSYGGFYTLYDSSRHKN